MEKNISSCWPSFTPLHDAMFIDLVMFRSHVDGPRLSQLAKAISTLEERTEYHGKYCYVCTCKADCKGDKN